MATLSSTTIQNKAAMGFIFMTMLIDITGLGIIIPVIPKLIEQLIHGNISQAAKYGGWLMFAYSVTQFMFAPMIGNLSDKYGRRPILLLSMLVFTIDYLLVAFAPTIVWLFIARIVSGITGASITTAAAYIADVSTPANRAKNFGMIGAAFGVGFIVGPVVGGLLGQYGARIPFFAAAALCFCNFLLGFFLLPESLSKENRRAFDIKKANPFGAFATLKKYPSLAGLALAMFLMYVAAMSVQGNWSYFTMYRFSFSEKMVGFSLGVAGFLVAIVQGGLIRYINPRLGNEKSIYIGLSLNALGLFLFAIANQGWMMFVFLIPYSLGGIAGPALQSIISSRVPANEQGLVQGTLASLSSLSSVVAPPVMSFLFYYFTHDQAPFKFAGASFLLGSVLMLLSVLVAYLSLKQKTAS